jgi:hypothetical protein
MPGGGGGVASRGVPLSRSLPLNGPSQRLGGSAESGGKRSYADTRANDKVRLNCGCWAPGAGMIPSREPAGRKVTTVRAAISSRTVNTVRSNVAQGSARARPLGLLGLNDQESMVRQH